jgi:RHS repeat-associated protein
MQINGATRICSYSRLVFVAVCFFASALLVLSQGDMAYSSSPSSSYPSSYLEYQIYGWPDSAYGVGIEGPAGLVSGSSAGVWTIYDRDPVFLGGGEFRYNETLLDLGGLIPLNFTLLYAPDLQFNKSPYNSGRTEFPPAERIRGFTSNALVRIVAFDDRCTFISYINVLLDGRMLVFRENEQGGFSAMGPEKFQIQQSGDYYYMMDPYEELVYIFRSRDVNTWVSTCQYTTKEGELIYVLDRNNNRLTYTYNDVLNLPTKIDDGLGRTLNFTYITSTNTANRHLSKVTDGYGRSVSFSYSECGNDTVLASYTDPLGNSTSFDYDETQKDCTLLEKIMRPLGNSHFEQSWTENPRGVDAIASQSDAYGNETTFDYVLANNQIIATATYPDNGQRIFRHQNDRYPLDATDPEGNEYSMDYDSDSQMTSVTDRLGDSTSITYHSQAGKIASITNARGDTTTSTYTAQSQTFTNPANSGTVTFTFYDLTRIDYPDGTNEQFSYDSKGNLLTRTDQAGKSWTYTYNSKGQILTATNPTNGVTTNTYNSDSTLASSTDSDTGTTTYSYDAYKRLTMTTNPDGTSVQTTYNLNDQLASITNENNKTYTYTYDANGNLTKVTDPASKETQYSHDFMDRVSQVIDRLGKVSSLAYNNMGRLATITDPTSVSTGFSYDLNGWLNQTSIGTRTWQRSHDAEGIVASHTTPLGNATTYQSDRLGFVSSITDALSQTSTLIRDSMSRISGVTDPLSRTTTYSYDSRGMLSSVTLPGVGSGVYSRDDLGQLSRIMDLNGENWVFSYTNMGRLQSATDPLNQTIRYSYDTRGRPSQTTFADSTTASPTYDDASNVTRLRYSDGADLQFSYDALDRLLAANSLTLTRDVEGRVTGTNGQGTSFGATYDDGGRLSTATYADGIFTVTYSYNATTGLLSRVTDDLSGAGVDFTYDNDNRLTGMTRSNGVNATLTWDNAGRLTRIQDGSTIDIQYTLDAAGQVSGANMTVPLDPATVLASETSSYTYNGASQLSSTGYTYDSRGRLTASPGQTYTWDGASRLTGIDGVTLTYNGLGDLIGRTESGSTIQYHYNYAIEMVPMVAEQDGSSGQYLRYYIWTPGGRLLYMIDAADNNKAYFYHFDRIGSTLALTGSSGTVADSYAYTPYGKLLQHTGTSQQPFTFVGNWGVRQEGSSGTLYHMRARYFEALTTQFLTRDPMWPLTDNPMEVNPYQYASADPISVIDPSGLAPEGGWDWVAAGDVSPSKDDLIWTHSGAYGYSSTWAYPGAYGYSSTWTYPGAYGYSSTWTYPGAYGYSSIWAYPGAYGYSSPWVYPGAYGYSSTWAYPGAHGYSRQLGYQSRREVPRRKPPSWDTWEQDPWEQLGEAMASWWKRIIQAMLMVQGKEYKEPDPFRPKPPLLMPPDLVERLHQERERGYW